MLDKKTFKNIISWVIAIIVSFIVIRMAIRIIFLTFSFALDLVSIIAIGIPVLILSVPVYMLVRKKLLK
jgi:hypothetical protein